MPTPASLFTTTLLRTLGNSSISVCIPINATTSDDSAQLGITVDGTEMSVISFEADEFSGAPYLYRIVVKE